MMMLFFSQSALTKSFVARVIADGGRVESTKCIDEKLKI